MMNSRNEVDFLEALDMLGVPEELLGKLVESGKLKSRRADGTLYFLRAEIDALIQRQVEEVRSAGLPRDDLGEITPL